MKCLALPAKNNKQLLDQAEQNIVICQWQAESLFADTKGYIASYTIPGSPALIDKLTAMPIKYTADI